MTCATKVRNTYSKQGSTPSFRTISPYGNGAWWNHLISACGWMGFYHILLFYILVFRPEKAQVLTKRHFLALYPDHVIES